MLTMALLAINAVLRCYFAKLKSLKAGVHSFITFQDYRILLLTCCDTFSKFLCATNKKVLNAIREFEAAFVIGVKNKQSSRSGR